MNSARDESPSAAAGQPEPSRHVTDAIHTIDGLSVTALRKLRRVLERLRGSHPQVVGQVEAADRSSRPCLQDQVNRIRTDLNEVDSLLDEIEQLV